MRGDIKIEGEEKYEDYSRRTKIRGRSNTTWSYPKKPYKLKLIDAAPLFGLASYKKWILLANWRDGSLLINSIPYEMAHLLGMPFANHIIPVELTLNGEYQGLYVFTEHEEVGKNRIDVGTGKNAGVLFELDYLMDEPYIFRSDSFDLPVMLHYPILDKWEDQAAVSDRFNEIKDHFNRFLGKVADSSFPHNDYLDTYISSL